MTRSYVCINTWLYSVYGGVKAATQHSQPLIDYRNRWLDALLVGSRVEAVIALGQAADKAWTLWRATAAGQASQVAYAPVTHPTQPESSSKGDKAKLAEATAKLLQNWNAALAVLAPAIAHPDVAVAPVPYGSAWADGDRVAVPESDFPAGLPSWMHEHDGWAARVGATELAKRRDITITVPAGIVD